MGRTRESANLVSDKNIFVDIANDLVGVGTTAPTATLEVSGTLNVSGVSTFASDVSFSDDVKALFGDGSDLQIYHDGNKRIRNSSNLIIEKTDGEDMASFVVDGAVNLFHNGTKKFETTSAGVTVTGTVTADGLSLGDSEYAYFGAGNDLQIFTMEATVI